MTHRRQPARHVLFLALLFPLFGGGARAGTEEGFVSIFDGRTLDGWEGQKEYWSVEDGAITCRMEGQENPFSYLRTRKRYRDFELKLDYYVPRGNSGIQYRSEPRGWADVIGPQADIESGDTWSGALYEVGQRAAVAMRGERVTLHADGTKTVTQFADPRVLQAEIRRDGWNSYHIIARGNHVTHKINGHVMVDVIDNQRGVRLKRGVIALQGHKGGPMKAQFKNIRIRVLSAGDHDIEFEVHRIGDFRGEACDVGDFTNDGRLDIVAGDFWYEAPAWTKHRFRRLAGEVGRDGRGYMWEFMDLPIDVDGDGLKDVVTCSWHGKRIEWYRNTGRPGDIWPMTIIDDKSGFYECGDLWDIDGDGRKNEILCHTAATQWYEVVKERSGSQCVVRHVVSSTTKNWGGGVGDINGDGRPDIVRPDAWYEAPEDPRGGRWTEHPLAVGHLEEGRADHTPQIWVYDVNQDGLGDIVTSSAHEYGIFWYQQVISGGARGWKQHIIDRTWTQAHSLALVDLDHDGDLDLVTGKRFFAHDGHDPGAFEPLGVYWYELTPGRNPKWTKHTISYGQGIGAGMSIPVIDIDADGDLDLVVTGKYGGPYLFENLSR